MAANSSDKLGPFRAVIFDLDGVLTDTARYHSIAWRSLARQLSIPFDAEFNEQLKGVGRMESLELILQHGGVVLSVAEKQNWAARKNKHYKELIADITPRDCFAGVVALLNDLRSHGIKIGLASASRNAPDILRGLKIEHYFDFRAEPVHIAHGKPAPDIFLAAAKGLNVPPHQCIGIEDAAAGIESILSAGMYAIGVGQYQPLHRAHRVIESINQFRWRDYPWLTAQGQHHD